MERPRSAVTERRTLAALIGAVVLAFVWLVLRPLLAPLVLAVLLRVIFQPIHGRIERRLGERSLWSALASLLAVSLLAGAPVTGLAILLLAQARTVLREILGQEEVRSRLAQLTQQLVAELSRLADTGLGRALELEELGQQALSEMATGFYHQLPDLLGHAGRLGFALLILLITLFFLLWRGRDLLDWVVTAAPLRESYCRRIAGRLEGTINGVFLGGLTTAAVQGIVGAAGFWLTGFENFLVWGAMVAAAGLIPFVGTGLVWGPAALYLFLIGNSLAAAGMLAVGAVVGTVDNLIRPLLIHERAAVHPLLVFLSLAGGFHSLGPMGLIYGPLLAAVLVESVRIYREDLLPYLRPPAPAPAAEASAATVETPPAVVQTPPGDPPAGSTR